MARRGYPPEFRRRVIDLVESGRKVTEVAVELEVSVQTICTWRRSLFNSSHPSAAWCSGRI
jgi:transposase-like protein